MYIVPLYIQFENFLSYEKETFYFEKGFHLIYGVNGSGKSNIFEGILYCLTGRTFKGLKGDEVIRDGQKSCKIKFAFMADDLKGMILIRRNPNQIFFKVGEKKYESYSIKEKQKIIQEWFGLDFEVLTKFFFVGENEKYKFSFLGSEDNEKKKLLTKISNSEIIDDALEIVKNKVEKYQNEYNSCFTIKEERKKDLFELKQDLDEKRNELVAFKKQSEKNFEQKNIEKITNKAKNNFLLYKIEYENIEKEVEKFIKQKEKELDEINSIIAKINSEREKFLIEKNIILLRIKSIIKCNKCGNLINNTGKPKEYWDKKIFEIEGQIKNLELNKQKKEDELKQKKDYKKNIDYISLLKKKNFAEEKRDTNEQIYLKNKDILLKMKINQQSEKKFIMKQINELKEKIKLKNESILDLQEKENDIKQQLDLFKKYLYWFGKEGFKNYLFSKKLKLIEFTVNKVLKEIGTDTYIILDGLTRLKSGKFSKKIKGFIFIDGKKKREYKELSKGEARKIDLAFIIAFRKLLSFKNIFSLSSFDEPFGGLDNKNLSSVIEMLKKTNYSTYIISPNEEIQEYFDSNEIINVEKINGISKIN